LLGAANSAENELVQTAWHSRRTHKKARNRFAIPGNSQNNSQPSWVLCKSRLILERFTRMRTRAGFGGLF
jgi:hypothetical protein